MSPDNRHTRGVHRRAEGFRRARRWQRRAFPLAAAVPEIPTAPHRAAGPDRTAPQRPHRSYTLGRGRRERGPGKGPAGAAGGTGGCPPVPRPGGSAPAAFPPSAAGPSGRREPAVRRGQGRPCARPALRVVAKEMGRAAGGDGHQSHKFNYRYRGWPWKTSQGFKSRGLAVPPGASPGENCGALTAPGRARWKRRGGREWRGEGHVQREKIEPSSPGINQKPRREE